MGLDQISLTARGRGVFKAVGRYSEGAFHIRVDDRKNPEFWLELTIEPAQLAAIAGTLILTVTANQLERRPARDAGGDDPGFCVMCMHAPCVCIDHAEPPIAAEAPVQDCVFCGCPLTNCRCFTASPPDIVVHEGYCVICGKLPADCTCPEQRKRQR